MPTIDTSREQMFPKFSAGEIDRLRRFGTVRRYAAGELLFATGDIVPGMFVIVSGSVAVTGREGLGRVFPIIELGLGGFLAEVVSCLVGPPSWTLMPSATWRRSSFPLTD